MSYISIPRLVFSGTFQSDVSTVNNDVRHFDNAAFKPRFQLPQSGNELNGWWNPRGTGAFRLINVTVQQAVTGVGEVGDGDLAVGLYLSAQIERTAAKMVDFDPQFQMGSALWGLQVALTDGTTNYMVGDYLNAPFRDLYFGRVQGLGGSGGASAKYTSVLENVVWAKEAEGSATLKALMELSGANGNRLSANFMTFGYVTDSTNEAFTYGNITGSIGSWIEGSPKKFVLGRRFAPVTSANNPFANDAGIGFFDGWSDGEVVSLDLSNALQLADTSGHPADIGDLQLALVRKPDTIADGKVTPSAVEGGTVDDDQIWVLGDIDYKAGGWLRETAGIVDFKVPKDAQRSLPVSPLAIVTPASGGNKNVIQVRETYGGLFLRADNIEQRVDSYEGRRVAATVDLYGAAYGAPLPQLPISYTLNPPERGQGGSGRTAPPAPQAPIPIIGIPADKVHFAPNGQTGAGGATNLKLAFDPPGNPRGYIDGQIYKINYVINLGSVSGLPVNEQVFVHLRDAYAVPTTPDWDTDVKPVLQQYGNLYPIMSQGLFSFDDEEVVKNHARILAFAFTRPIEDPNHMPVTRDLSEPKREMILTWLEQVIGADEVAAMRVASVAPADLEASLAKAADIPGEPVPVGKAPGATGAMPEALADVIDGKTNAMRDILTARKQS